MRRLAAIVLLMVAAVPTATAAASTGCPKASLPDIEAQVMCLVCGVPLSLADSPQASRERDFINGLIERCQSSSQIKAALVAQYGPRVLALPKDSGFNAAAYIVPVLVLLFGMGLAGAVVRWWSSSRNRAAPLPAASPPSRLDARRLEAEIERWER